MQTERRVNEVREALAAPKIVLGANVKLVLLNIGMLSFMLLSLRVWQWIFVFFPLHWVARALTDADPDTLKVYVAYSKQGDRYEPWPIPGLQRRMFRPNGFGPKGSF